MEPEEYLLLAYEEATKSPDPSTQNGSALHVGDIVLLDHNRFPDNVEITPERLERPLKYQYIEHAERNAVYAAAKRGHALEGETLYVPWFACSDCARAIIQAGIAEVVGHQRMFDETPDRWKGSIKEAMTMLREKGVKTTLVTGELNGPEILFNEKPWRP